MAVTRSTIKSTLSLLAILCAFGVVGRMDYDDAVAMENAQKQAVRPDSPAADSISQARGIQAQQAASANPPGEPDFGAAMRRTCLLRRLQCLH